MPAPTRIEELADRKRQLVAECESHRQNLKLGLAELESAAMSSIQPLASIFSLSRKLLVLAPITGLFMGRGKRGPGSWLKAALIGWQTFKRVQPLWARFRRKPGKRE